MSEEAFPKNKPSQDAEQTDFFEILDTVYPSEDIRRIKLNSRIEIAFNPKEANVFHIFDYISQTTAEVYFDRKREIVSLQVLRFGGEGGAVEGIWKKNHEESAKKILSEQPAFFGL